MTMFGKLHFRGSLWAPPSGSRIKIVKTKFKIRYEHQKCFPMIYNMTMFVELHLGDHWSRLTLSLSPGAQKSKLGKTNSKSETSIKNAFKEIVRDSKTQKFKLELLEWVRTHRHGTWDRHSQILLSSIKVENCLVQCLESLNRWIVSWENWCCRSSQW